MSKTSEPVGSSLGCGLTRPRSLAGQRPAQVAVSGRSGTEPCRMTNHVYLAIETGETPLSKIIRNLSFRYTRWVNRRQRWMGHLIQGRYKAVLADGEG